MAIPTKDVTLKAVLFVCAIVVIALALLIPGILAFKVAHGASKLACLALLAGYIGSWIVMLLCLPRFRKHGHDAIFGILWGLCFFSLLFLSGRL